MSTSDADHRAVADFLYREARLADEARYAEWLGLWTDDGVYWVPATTDPGADPERHLSHIYEDVETWYLNFDFGERVPVHALKDRMTKLLSGPALTHILSRLWPSTGRTRSCQSTRK